MEKLTVKMLAGEHWWGGSSSQGEYEPSDAESKHDYDMFWGSNQTMPLFLSDMGRYIWCDRPMKVHLEKGVFELFAPSEIILCEAGKTLRDAYLVASRKHFPFSGKIPPQKFFTTAQYNTWMELDYNQTQEGVLRYARGLIEHGYEPGVLMIDEGWHMRYGIWEFDTAKFPNPKAMVDELHAMGFTVMLWVVPAVTVDGKDFVIACDPVRTHLSGGGGNKIHFLRTDSGDVAIVKWWNGYSAILNMCNEDDREFLDSKLRYLMETYGVDGFKFDGGNISMYNPENIVNGTQTRYTADELNLAWNDFGTRYLYHEYKDTFKGGGKPVVQRLQDRNHKWNDHGLTSILPAALLQGLIGHPFICPDMVGGGEWSFNYVPNFQCDQELFVRMAQCSALFPMIQYSWAPWRMLDEKHSTLCHEAAMLHKRYAAYIMELVNESAVSGEPIVRHMEYECPHCGYEKITDQFFLGSDILVAPVMEQGQTVRRVVLPAGKWLYGGVTEYEGGKTVEVPAPIEALPYFVRLK